MYASIHQCLIRRCKKYLSMICAPWWAGQQSDTQHEPQHLLPTLLPITAQEHVSLLRLLRPDATRIVIPFNRNVASALPYGVLPDACGQFGQACRARGFIVVYCGFSPPRFPSNTVLVRTRPGDIIVARAEYGLAAHVEELARRCCQNRITLITYGLTSVRTGAAMALHMPSSSCLQSNILMQERLLYCDRAAAVKQGINLRAIRQRLRTAGWQLVIT